MSLPLDRITHLLSKQLGLSGQSLGGRAIDSAVHRRMASIKVDSIAEYAERVEKDRRELDELIEAVVVPETWFFRYPESFRHLGEFCKNLSSVRILSAPCATGEECYSIAMALSEAGLPLSRVQIDGVDVSRRAIDFAKQGSYGEHAFREPQTPPRDRYFLQHKADFAVRPELKSRISFRTANLADVHFLPGEQPYDAIFCRNLFIYLTDDARQTVLKSIDRLLAPHGVVYMGHAEPLTIMDQRFKSLSPPQAFVFTRGVSGNLSKPVFPADTIDLTMLKPASSGPMSTKTGSGLFPMVTPQTPMPQNNPTEAEELLHAARTAADAGQLAQAEAFCDQLLKLSGPSAEAYALLGTLRLIAQDLASAERNFTRALYLDPMHYDALLQMMTLSERRGDTASAGNYRRRLTNVEKRRGTP